MRGSDRTINLERHSKWSSKFYNPSHKVTENMADWEAVNLPMNEMVRLDDDGAAWCPLERRASLRVRREGKLILPHSNLSRNISRLVPTLLLPSSTQWNVRATWQRIAEEERKRATGGANE